MRVGGRVAQWGWWHCLLTLLVLTFLFGVTDTAHAASFYWYGANPDCWQTGTPPGAPGEACDSGGGVISNAISGDLNVSQSGDYCNTYNVNNTICNDEGATWPLSFKYTAACEHDSPACGIHHYTSFANQNDQPWGKWGNSPQLVLSSELAMTSVTAPQDAWAYLCAVLQAPGTKLFVEDCFDRWQGSATQENLPEPPFASRSYGLGGICGGVTVNGERGADDQVVTAFAPNAPTPFGTTIAGTTITGGTTGTNHFQVTISTANVANAIARDNQAPPTGCSRGLPTNVGEYRFVGIEDGIEGGVHTQLAATTSHLRAWTEYTPLPPEATTNAATGVQETQAQLNGTVNPKGTDTHYYFQYGMTTGYGSSTASKDAGSGMSFVPDSATATGLDPGGVYHYRMVATSAGGTVYGNDQTVVISEVQANSRWTDRDPNTEVAWVYFVESNGAIGQLYWQPTEKKWNHVVLGGKGSAGTSPSVIRDPTTEIEWVYYVENREIAQWYWEPHEKQWHHALLGGKNVASGTSPTVDRNPSTGVTWVYYVESSGAIAQLYWSEGKWNHVVLGGKGSAGTSPSVIRDPTTEIEWVYYVENGEIAQWYWEPHEKQWHHALLGGKNVASGTSPTVDRNPSTGVTWVYYVESSGAIAQLYWSEGKWNHVVLGGKGSAGTSPSVIRDPTTEIEWVYYVENGEIAQWYWEPHERQWHHVLFGGKVASGVTPAVIRDNNSEIEWVDYIAANGAIQQWYWEPGHKEWFNVVL